MAETPWPALAAAAAAAAGVVLLVVVVAVLLDVERVGLRAQAVA